MPYPARNAAWIVTTLLLVSLPAAAQSALSPSPDHPLYDDLEHFRALGLWRGSLEIRPLSWSEICAVVAEIGARADELRGEPNRMRLRRLERFCDAWGPWEVSPAAAPGTADPACFLRAETGLQFVGGPADLTPLVDLDRRPRRRGAAVVACDAQIGSCLGVRVRIWEDYSRLSAEPSHHWVDNLPIDASGILEDPYARNDLALLSCHHRWLDVRLGREERCWGVGRRGTLFLSENPFPMDGVSLRIRTRHFTVVSLFAQTQRGPDPPSLEEGQPYAADQHTPGDAYYAGHRLEISPPGPFGIGLYEAAVYGGRGIDLAYLNPVGILVAMAQDIANRTDTDDKKVIGLDLRCDLPPVTLYGELMLDRLVSGESAAAADQSEISSFAELIGLRWADPGGWCGADLDVEYAHLDPQVYFHHDRDVRRAFLVDGESLEDRLIGHWLGPNADALYIALQMPPASWGGLGLLYEQARWGLIGGQRGLEAGFVGIQKWEDRWIYGEIATERSAALTWEPPIWRMTIPGEWTARLRLAYTDRSGSLGGDGWQAELRLRWTAARVLLRP